MEENLLDVNAITYCHFQMNVYLFLENANFRFKYVSICIGAYFNVHMCPIVYVRAQM